MILRLIGYLFGIGAVLFLAVAAGVAYYVSGLTHDLPNYDVLAQYEPPVMTRVHAADGQLVAEYARERRLYLPIPAIPRKTPNPRPLPKSSPRPIPNSPKNRNTSRGATCLQGRVGNAA